MNPDDLFETFVYMLLPLWGPFYAVFYLLRLMWREMFGPREEETKE